MKEGDIVYPIGSTNIRKGQLTLPLWGDKPALLIQKELYVSKDPNDCQSETEDWRWVVLHDGCIQWWTETMIDDFYECR